MIGLEEAVYDGRMSDDEILSAISTVLDKSALRWRRATLDSLYTWREFRREFKAMYVIEYDEEDLWRDLRQCTQGEGEKVTAYISSQASQRRDSCWCTERTAAAADASARAGE